MDKRYQVFVSSTFLDLQQERQAAMRAVLELGHMPAGMELFPADDDGSWQLIQDVIDASDYYVVIVGGRYGTTDDEGVGYTEREYDYAVSRKKPIMAFLHAAPGELPRDRTETEGLAWDRLEQFRAKLEASHSRKTWTNPESLQAALVTSLTANMKRHPQEGWVRASEVPSDASLRDVVGMQARVRELEDRLARERTHAPEGTEDLSQGAESFNYHVEVESSSHEDFDFSVLATWDEIFAVVAPTFINEASGPLAEKVLHDCLQNIAMDLVAGEDEFRDVRVTDITVDEKDNETCLLQFRALGLISESQKKRSVNDTRTYWALTPFGDHLMTKLRALKSERKTKS